eukprot:39502-Pelagomonas_calceolata.AAC.2
MLFKVSNQSVTAACFVRQAGLYEVSLMVGHPEVSQGLVWKLGQVELVLPTSDPSPSVRTAHTQPISNVRPIITHMFVSVDMVAATLNSTQQHICRTSLNSVLAKVVTFCCCIRWLATLTALSSIYDVLSLNSVLAIVIQNRHPSV